MCGICGFAGTHERLTATTLSRMNDAIAHRGPDDSGELIEPGLGLAMRRLSILDLAGSHQPLSNEDETVWVVYNGEIYNYRAVREALVRKGHRFKTQGDTEILVHLYEDYGPDMVQHLRGMFAFALFDRKTRTLLLARDRLGIKPLFYAEHEGNLIFASEMKAILQTQVVPTEMDWQAVDAYLAFTYVPAPRTIYRSISKLPPGHVLIHRAGQTQVRQYWDVDFGSQENGLDATAWQERIGAKLQDAVQSHLVSDVPLGAFLSGGIDSSLVVSMMSKAVDEPVETFTMGFAGDGLALIDERPYAKLLGERYAVRYNDFTVEPDFRDILDYILAAFDEPFADDSVIPSYYISKLTRQKVKVALSGLGGDELFGGYHRYRGLLMSTQYGRTPAGLRAGIDGIVRWLPESGGGGDRVDHLKRFSRFSRLPEDERYLGYVSSLDVQERRRLYGPELLGRVDFEATSRVITDPFNACASPDVLDRAFYTDLKTYLPDDILALSDRLSMWHSLELRVPLIDHELTELAATMPSRYKVRTRSTKWLLKRVAEAWLPADIIHHRKQGFESPMAAWLKSGLRDFAHDVLTDRSVTGLGLFDAGEIQRLFDEHVSGRRKNNKILLSLIMLFSWMKKSGAA
jgi:asparagine synthase (glutamine-hydrolysing)